MSPVCVNSYVNVCIKSTIIYGDKYLCFSNVLSGFKKQVQINVMTQQYVTFITFIHPLALGLLIGEYTQTFVCSFCIRIWDNVHFSYGHCSFPRLFYEERHSIRVATVQTTSLLIIATFIWNYGSQCLNCTMKYPVSSVAHYENRIALRPYIVQ